MRFLVAAWVILSATGASAATVQGLVFEDTNGDGTPQIFEPAVANAVVAFGVSRFVTTDAAGQFSITVPDGAQGIVWVRVPEGFRPGPVWQKWSGVDIELPLHRLAAPVTGPLTFVVAADTHIWHQQTYFGEADLAAAAADAVAIEPGPAFFTILGDITQGNANAEFDLVEGALGNLGVPWIPVPGNHDWYDGGATWFRRFGPDNYSFDIGGVHFVVWNMAMSEGEIRNYLGAELSRVASGVPVVAMTHAPPSPQVVNALRALGVDYVLTGHAHSNRPVDHYGIIELNTEPMLMGGLDFTPGGYRVITIDNGKLTSYHRTVVDGPQLALTSPARGQCMKQSTQILVAAEIDPGASALTATIDCGTPVAMRWAGGWTWRADLPPLEAGAHTLAIDGADQKGERLQLSQVIEVCDPGAAPPQGPAWYQHAGGPAHLGTRAHEIAPPLVTRWTTPVGGHVLHAAPVIANGAVYVATTDLADGDAGGVVAIDLATGELRWRARTSKPVRGGPAIVGNEVIAAQIDGTLLALDAATGAVRWRYELSAGFQPTAGALFGSPAIDEGDILVGHQRAVAAFTSEGSLLWSRDPVPKGVDSQSAAAIAVAGNVAVGTFNRALGGVIAWDRLTGEELWRFEGPEVVAINGSPVITGDTVWFVTGATDVFALDIETGHQRWRTKLDGAGFDWGHATIATPALSNNILIVPLLYRDVVALDATTGAELWRFAGTPSELRVTHYRGRGEAGFSSSPVITGDIVWVADTAGVITALELRTGLPIWKTSLGVPMLAGLAASGDWLIAASYDGTVRALVPTQKERPTPAPPSCTEPPPASGGCCDASSAPSPLLILVAWVLLRRRA